MECTSILETLRYTFAQWAVARHPDKACCIKFHSVQRQWHKVVESIAFMELQICEKGSTVYGQERLTRQKLIAHVNPAFCALFRTCVYAKKKAIVIIAPMIIVPRRPQKKRDLHMNPARIGEGTPEKFAKA